MTAHYFVQTVFPPTVNEYTTISEPLRTIEAAREFVAQCHSDKPMRIIRVEVVAEILPGGQGEIGDMLKQIVGAK